MNFSLQIDQKLFKQMIDDTENKYTLDKSILQQYKQFCQQLLQYSKNNSLFKKNQNATELKSDITSEDAFYLLSYYYYGQLLNKFDTENKNRLQILQQALDLFDDFIQISITYDLYSEDIYIFITKQKPFSRDIIVTINKELNKYKQQFNQEKGNLENQILYLLNQKIYQVLLDKKYLLDEMEMVEYDMQHKNDKKEQKQIQYKPIQVHKIDQDTVKLIQQENKFIPLDEIEKLKLNDINKKVNQMKTQSRHDQDVDKYIQEKERIKNLSDSDEIDDYQMQDQQMHFGLINDGKEQKYRVVKQIVQNIGSNNEKEMDENEAFKLEQQGLLQQESDKETSQETKEKAEWEDWTDQNRKGEGRKYNNIF